MLGLMMAFAVTVDGGVVTLGGLCIIAGVAIANWRWKRRSANAEGLAVLVLVLAQFHAYP